MLKNIKDLINQSSYRPNIFSYLLNPFHTARKNIFTAINKNEKKITGSILDVGCGGMPYKGLFTNTTQYTGLDIDQPRNRERSIADDYYDGTVFPYADNSIDNILCSQVLEHVFEPDQFVSEIHRVLTPEGRILLSVPFIWDEHEQPWDYTRYTSFGLKYLFEKHGFTIEHQEKLGLGMPAFIQLFEGYIYKKVQRIYAFPLGKIVLGICIFFPLNLLAEVAQLFKTSDSDFYLDNLIIATKKRSS